MRYRTYLIFFIIYFAGYQPAFAQVEQYRVELLVLRHLSGVAELEPQATLRDFSAAMDLLQPPVEPSYPETPGAGEPAAEVISTAQPSLEETANALNEEAVEEPEVGPQAVLIETQSEVMQQAWQRLRSSSAYKPELYLSWQQPGEEPFPSIRVHDGDVLVEFDPYADQRASAAAAADEVPAFSDTTTPVSGIIEAGNGAIDEPQEVIPEPIRYYRIDGTARLRKTRFLHLDLDLEYREALFSNAEQNHSNQAPEPQVEDKSGPSAFLVHTLKQNRQVQTQDMEYFDGPVFAVLAKISRVETSTEPGAETAQSSE